MGNELVNLENISADFDLSENSAYVKELAKVLKKTYVCSSSNETLYSHYFDEIYKSLVGDSSSAGTYFLDIEYEWLSQYYSDKKIEIIKRVEYSELLDSIS